MLPIPIHLPWQSSDLRLSEYLLLSSQLNTSPLSVTHLRVGLLQMNGVVRKSRYNNMPTWTACLTAYCSLSGVSGNFQSHLHITYRLSEADAQKKECFAKEQNRLPLLYFSVSFSLGESALALKPLNHCWTKPPAVVSPFLSYILYFHS